MGSIISTQVILAKLEDMGLPVMFRDRLRATAHDLLGLATTYLPLMAVALLLALPVASRLGRLKPRLRVYCFGLAGFFAVIALHVIAKAVLGVNGLASVRELHGLLLQGLAGWFGGYLFFLFTAPAPR